IDLNGRVGLVSVNPAADRIGVVWSNGDGTFQPALVYPVGHGPTSVAVGDLNGDGALDLVVADQADSTLSVLLGNGDGTFGPATSFRSTLPNPTSVALGDFDGDGSPDLVVAHSPTAGAPAMVSVWHGVGGGTFAEEWDGYCGNHPPWPWPWPIVV